MNEPRANPRTLVYTLLITVAAAAAAGRIVATERVPQASLYKAKAEDAEGRAWPEKRPPPMPTFSSNDVSRWATIRALVDDGTYVIGRRDQKAVAVSLVAALAASSPVE